MQGGEVVIGEGEILNLITLQPIKSSPKNMALQSVLHNVSLCYGIPLSRFEIGWKQKSDKGMLKSDIVIYDSSSQGKKIVGLIHCIKFHKLT
jgi:hypothetical protein